MNQLDIYCFTSIARTKSFSITARELMISQQAVSNHIKTLEEEVGYTLFFRYGQAAVLTKAGEIMLDFFIKRDRLTAEFFREHKVKDESTPFLIAWTQWAGCPTIAQEILEGFRKQYPNDVFLVADMPAEKVRGFTEQKDRCSFYFPLFRRVYVNVLGAYVYLFAGNRTCPKQPHHLYRRRT